MPVIGYKYDGKIISIKPHGAVVEFNSRFVGYLNKHHLNWGRTKILTKTTLKIGDKIEVKVIKFKPITHKYILSHKILQPRPMSKKEKRKRLTMKEIEKPEA